MAAQGPQWEVWGHRQGWLWPSRDTFHHFVPDRSRCFTSWKLLLWSRENPKSCLWQEGLELNHLWGLFQPKPFHEEPFHNDPKALATLKAALGIFYLSYSMHQIKKKGTNLKDLGFEKLLFISSWPGSAGNLKAVKRGWEKRESKSKRKMRCKINMFYLPKLKVFRTVTFVELFIWRIFLLFSRGVQLPLGSLCSSRGQT